MKFPLSVFLFLFFVLISLTSGQPFNTEISSNGLRVFGPENFPVQQNTGFNFTFHVFNQTLGEKVETTAAECNFFLMDKLGNTVIEKVNISKSDRYFWIFVEGGNFSKMTEHDYLVTCSTDNSELTGTVRTSFIVTADGGEFRAFPNQFFLIIMSLGSIFLSYFSRRLSLFRYIGSIMIMILGTITIYPGYNFINHSNLLGISIGSGLIALGFYFLIEDSFSRKRQASSYEKDHKEDEEDFEINEELFEDE